MAKKSSISNVSNNDNTINNKTGKINIVSDKLNKNQTRSQNGFK
jgi:hypothetical protein